MLPARIYAAASLEASYSLPNHSPADDWESYAVLRNKETQTSYKVPAVADGGRYKITVAAETSGLWEPGEYNAYIYATKDTAKEVAWIGTTQVLPNPEGNKVADALRDELAAVNKAIAGVLAGEGVETYSFETAVGRRSATRMSLEELRKHRRDVEARLENHEARTMGRQSRYGHRTIQSKFTR